MTTETTPKPKKTSKPVTPSKKKPLKPITSSTISKSFFSVKIILNSFQAQKIMNDGRGFSHSIRCLYNIELMIPILIANLNKKNKSKTNEENSDSDFIRTTDFFLQKASEYLKKKEKIFLEKIEKNGIDTLCEYSSPKTYDFQLSSASSRKLVGLLEQMDLIVQYIDTLALSGVIEPFVRIRENWALQGHLKKLTRTLHLQEIMARKYASNLGARFWVSVRVN